MKNFKEMLDKDLDSTFYNTDLIRRKPKTETAEGTMRREFTENSLLSGFG